jgi:hypothetical protein
MPPTTPFDALNPARLGGISGLAIDRTAGDLLGISDDHANTRVFVFSLPPARTPFRVDMHAYFPLPVVSGVPDVLDPEGIAITRDGRLFVSSEGAQNREPRVQPGILEYTRGYEFVGQLAVPEKFRTPSTGPVTQGVRSNASLESLTLSPDERRLFTATESPLVQDGEAASSRAGGLVRVIEYEGRGRAFEPRREFVYPIDPLPEPPFTPRFAVTGLVELLALGDRDFLALERGYAEEAPQGRSVNHIRIFRMTLEGATDVSGLESLKGQSFATARKTLILDLANVKGLSRELTNLDNFEGMTFGSVLPDGSRTLLLVSDDNFNARQRTSFLWFRLAETP